MLVPTLLFVLGFVFLVKGADLLIDGATVIAKRFSIPNIVIGLTIVSIGTSAPELVVNIISGVKGYSEIALGNIFGSNIANILLVLGIGALLRPLVIHYKKIRFDLLVSALAVLAMLFFAYTDYRIVLWEGLCLLILFILYLYITFKRRKEIYEEDIHPMKIWAAAASLLAGIIMLYLGGKWVVDGVVFIADQIFLSKTFIALTVVALGTSLPELTVTIISIKRNNYELAIGNAIGSNIFNILWVIGFGSMLAPITFYQKFYVEICFLLTMTLVLFIFIKYKEKIARWQGALFLLSYITYITYIFFRN